MISRLLLLLLLVWTAPVLAGNYRNCGQDWSLQQDPPQRILALNQHAADLLMALEIGPALVGVSYIDDEGAIIDGHYQGVPVLSRHYPSTELLFARRIDFVVGGFASAFRHSHGSREALRKNGIAAYLLEGACGNHGPSYIDAIKRDLQVLGLLLKREPQALAARQSLERDLLAARTLSKGQRPLSVFYFDSEVKGLDTQGGQGFVSELLHAAGAKNTFDAMNFAGFTVNSETLLMADPDVILLADALWSPASRKRYFLSHDPVLSRLRAVREGRFIELPFTHAVPGVHSGQAALRLAQALQTHQPPED